MKILVDESDDGLDEKLAEAGYEAYSVKKLIAEGKRLHSDYSVVNYARENKMLLITRDSGNALSCEENNISYICPDKEAIFKIVVEKLVTFDSST